MVPGCRAVPCSVSAEVFRKLLSQSVDAAVIPIENTLAGSVAEHYDLLLAKPVFIEREFHLRIIHNLIVAPGVRLADLKRVFSHPVALDQCREFFRKNPKIQSVPFYDTAGSVKHVVKSRLRDSAGIAAKHAAREYGGHVLKAGIEDNKQNFTRFFLISRTRKNGFRHKRSAGANKTSICFAVKNIPGVLFKALSVFALRDISLTKIESRPVPGRPWEYVFYVDLLGGYDQPTENALRHLAEISEFVKVLGVYKAA